MLVVSYDCLRHLAINAVQNFLDGLNVAILCFFNQLIDDLAQFGDIAVFGRLVERSNELLRDNARPLEIGFPRFLVASLKRHASHMLSS